jgi:hypothetical protein
LIKRAEFAYFGDGFPFHPNDLVILKFSKYQEERK